MDVADQSRKLGHRDRVVRGKGRHDASSRLDGVGWVLQVAHQNSPFPLRRTPLGTEDRTPGLSRTNAHRSNAFKEADMDLNRQWIWRISYVIENRRKLTRAMLTKYL